jgi:tripartite ATP-independent transporter DctP family solute receptor
MTRSAIGRRTLVRTAAAAGALPLFGILAPAARAAEFRLKYANNQPLTHPMNIRAKEMAKRISEESKGRVQLMIFPNNQLGGDTDMVSQIRSGAIDFYTGSGLLLQTFVPVAGINGIGYAFKNYDQVWAAMDGALGAHVRQAIAGAGLIAFEKIWDNGFRQTTTSTHPIAVPADFKGLKIRVPVMELETSLFQSLGASPTAIDIKEAYSALQTHLADGQENPLALIQNWKFYEVQKYCSLTGHMWDGFWMLANGKNFARLPKDLQEIVARNVNRSGEDERADVRKLNDSLQGALQAKGMVFNKPAPEPFQQQLRDSGFYAHWRDKFGAETWSLLEASSGRLA